MGEGFEFLFPNRGHLGEGNLLNDGSKTYTYDQANRLTTTTAASLTWNATYNGDGARLRQVTNGVPTTYTLDLAAPLVQALVQQDSSGTTRYLYGVMRVGEQQPAGWVYHLPDALGSVRQLADGSAQVTLARGYMPYGEALWSVGSGNSAYGFTGETFDASVALVFLRARYMQPGLGVFLSRDPWEGDVSQPKTLNPYAYSLNNPVLLTDPSGKIPCPLCWIIIALLLGGCDTDTSEDPCAPPENLSSVDLEHTLTREGALANIQIQFNIKLPPEYQFEFYPSVSTRYGVVAGYVPWFDDADHGKVFITEGAFTGVPRGLQELPALENYNAFDIAGVMVHEAVHAWQQHSITKMAEDPNSDFSRSNTPPDGLSYLTVEWRREYFLKPSEIQAEEYVRDHWPCTSEAYKRTSRFNIDANSGNNPNIPGTDSDQIKLVGVPLP